MSQSFKPVSFVSSKKIFFPFHVFASSRICRLAEKAGGFKMLTGRIFDETLLIFSLITIVGDTSVAKQQKMINKAIRLIATSYS